MTAAAPAAAAPTVTEFPIPVETGDTPPEPADIVLGPDGKLWFTEANVDQIGRVTPGNPPVIDEFDLPAGFTSPFNITVGHDGKIWFTCSNGAGALCRINPNDPTDKEGKGGYNLQGQAAGIAAGPDGAMWLGGQTASVIRADATTMDELADSDFTITGFNIRNLAPGPDGNVWVTDFGGKIARVTPSGAFTPFDPAGDAAWDIVTGPDGNLWYTAPEGADTKIGRVTPAGDVGLQYSATPVGDQRGITVGPDGALWFAEAFSNDIGRMTLDGQFTTVTGLSPGARPEYIAPGPDNTLWFTEKDGHAIGRITGLEVGGNGGPPPPPPPPDAAPDVIGLDLSRNRFRLGSALPSAAAVKTGTTIRFTISEAATVRLSFRRLAPGRRVRGRCVRPTRLNRSRRRCTRSLRVRGSVSLPVQAGARRIKFAGRLSARRRLRPGRYQLILTARDAAGNVSTPDRARFRLLPKRPRR
jgi:streptogramin lyase